MMNKPEARALAEDFFCHIKGAGATIDFRTFDDNKDRADRTLTCKLRGTIEECFDALYDLNQQGAGIFFTVNTTDGGGVRRENINSIQYLWIEDDGDDPKAVARCPLDYMLKVRTSKDHYHYYYRVEPESISVEEFKSYQSIMAEQFGSDKNALDPGRVLRAAGFFHCKIDSRKALRGDKQLVEVVDSQRKDAITVAELQGFKRVNCVSKHLVPFSGSSFLGASSEEQFRKSCDENNFQKNREVILRDLNSALEVIPSDDRGTWVKVGYALANIGDDGRRLWVDWSKKSDKFDDRDAMKQWSTFAESKSRYQLIFKLATELGWANPWKRSEPHCDVALESNTTMAAEMNGGGELAVKIQWIDTNINGKPIATVANTRQLLESANVKYCFNELIKDRSFILPGITLSHHNSLDNAFAHLKSLAIKNGLPREPMLENSKTLADSVLFHPVKEWIESTPWDGIPRYTELLRSLDPVDKKLAEMLLKPWLISCVAAVYEDKGVAAQGVLVLQGEQGCGKTTFLKNLCGEHDEFFRESLLVDPNNKDTVRLGITRWISELGELGSTLRKSDIEELKAFLTKDEDEFRLPYAASESKWPRRTIFCATVNDVDFLQDTTGNRRFWVLAVGSPRQFRMPDMQQVWAEIKLLYDRKGTWVLSPDELTLLNASNLSYSGTCPFEEKIQKAFSWGSDSRANAMTVTDICTHIGISSPSRVDTSKVGKAVRRLLKVSKPRKSSGSSFFDMPEKNSPEQSRPFWGGV
ncbi:MAG: VapE domain-containing protein [Candidatus Reddybacter sp.]